MYNMYLYHPYLLEFASQHHYDFSKKLQRFIHQMAHFSLKVNSVLNSMVLNILVIQLYYKDCRLK